MRTTRQFLLYAAALAALALPLSLVGINAIPVHAGNAAIDIEAPWVRMTIPGRPAAGYMTVMNKGATPDALKSAHSDQAERVELHTHSMDNGVMRMRQIESVDVPASGEVSFSSGGHHLMVFGLKPEVKPGSSVSITLEFEKAGSVRIDFPVEGIGTRKAPATTGQSGHHHKH